MHFRNVDIYRLVYGSNFSEDENLSLAFKISVQESENYYCEITFELLEWSDHLFFIGGSEIQC